MAESELSIEEAVKLAAVSPDFYNHFFFPKAFRQPSAPFHKDVWDAMLDPKARYVALKMYRDSAKTTNVRAYISNRIAFGVSRTILLIGLSEEAAVKSLDWIKRAVQWNTLWTSAFGLEKGEPWSNTQLCIRHTILGHEIRILAMGITGSTRGVNIDDYRPDLIMVDDVLDEENSATPESRRKMKELLAGLRHSLAPASDSPEAKFIMLQTPIAENDAIEEAMKDPQFRCVEVSCYTPSMDSSWPARWPKAVLDADKEAHIQRNQLSLWMREKEVRIVSTETAAWRADWLQYWVILPEPLKHYMGIDPTPPPRDGPQAKNLERLDDAVVMDIGLYKGEVHLIEYYCSKSPNPDDLINKIFEFYLRYRPMVVSLETTLFQRTLKFYLEREMRRRQLFMRLNPVEDRRKKTTRILQAISARASNRTIHVHATHTGFIEQFTCYPVVNHDDILDAFSIALSGINPSAEFIEGEFTLVDETPGLPDWRAAP